MHITNFFAQNLVVEKQEGVQGLILGGGAYMGITRQAGEELSDLCLTHFCRMSLLMEDDEPLHPADICFLSSIAIVPCMHGLACLVKKLGVRWLPMVWGPHGTKRRVHLDRLSGKEGQQLGDGVIGVGNRPILLLVMPAATDDGLDLRHALGGIGNEHDEPSRLPWPDLNRARRDRQPPLTHRSPRFFRTRLPPRPAHSGGRAAIPQKQAGPSGLVLPQRAVHTYSSSRTLVWFDCGFPPVAMVVPSPFHETGGAVEMAIW